MAAKPRPSAVSEALKAATSALTSSQDEYRKHLLASGSIRDALARAVADEDPTMGQLRSAKADVQKRLGTVFADSMDLQDITDPRMREAIRARRSSEYGAEAEQLGGAITDRQGSQDKIVDKFSSIFGALTGAKQFDVTSKENTLTRAQTAAEREESRRFDSRFDDLTRREKEASIAAANRSNRGGGGLTIDSISDLASLQKNPLVAMQLKGYRREKSGDGGWNFFDASGKPITAEEVSTAVGGVPLGSLLEGSGSSQDKATIQRESGKPLSAEGIKMKTIGESGLLSLRTVEDMLGRANANDILARSKAPFGSFNKDAQLYKTSARNIMDAVARVRTGAAMTKKEEQLYEQFVPGPTDAPEVRAEKMRVLRAIFDAASGGGSDPMALINQQMGSFPGYSPN